MEDHQQLTNFLYMMKDFLELKVKKIIRETAYAITLELENTDGQPIDYQSGQFLTFLLNIHGKELRRSYSLSSAPQIDKNLAVTISRVVNGEVSRYLIDNLKEGDILTALYPAGRFTLQTDASLQRDIFMIGAGSGITPLFSMLKTALKEEPKSRLTLIDSNKNENTALFWQQLKTLATQYQSRLKTIHLLSDPLPASNQYPVRLNIALLEKLINENLTYTKALAQFFVCGPPHFMRMVRMTLIFMGFQGDNIHKENFVTEALKESAGPVSTDTSPKIVTILYKKKQYAVEVPPHTSILKAALNQGIQLPYSCMGGMCSTCSGICKSGNVHMAINEVLTDKEVAQGWILTCVAFPTTDDVLVEIS
jgi:ring-1,2-phenylacetyl-CoA epoxidase subunit PaaE